MTKGANNKRSLHEARSFESNLFKASEASTRKNTFASSARRETVLTASENLSQMITINDESGTPPNAPNASDATNAAAMRSTNFEAKLLAIRETHRDLMLS